MSKTINYHGKKQRIAESAIKVFSERGYHNTSLANIAEQCGMGRTTLYQYFKNKDEILFYSTMQITRTFKKDFNTILVQDSFSSIDKIKLIIEKIFTQHENHPGVILLIELWFMLKRAQNSFVEKFYEYAFHLKDIFILLLGEASSLNEIKPVNIEYMAQTLSSLVESLILHLALHKDTEHINPNEQLKSIHLLIDGLKT